MRPAGCCRRLASNFGPSLLFWTPLLEGDEGRRVGNDPEPGCVPVLRASFWQGLATPSDAALWAYCRVGDCEGRRERAPRAVCLLRVRLKSVNQGDDPREEPGHRCEYRQVPAVEQPLFGGNIMSGRGPSDPEPPPLLHADLEYWRC